MYVDKVGSFLSQYMVCSAEVSKSAILAGIAMFSVSMKTNGTTCDLFFHYKDKIRREAEKVTMIWRKVVKQRNEKKPCALNMHA